MKTTKHPQPTSLPSYGRHRCRLLQKIGHLRHTLMRERQRALVTPPSLAAAPMIASSIRAFPRQVACLPSRLTTSDHWPTRAHLKPVKRLNTKGR